jgi:hypothetical protein
VGAAIGTARALTDPSSGVVEIDLNPIVVDAGERAAVVVDAVVLVDGLEPHTD